MSSKKKISSALSLMFGQKIFAGILNLFVLGYLARVVSKEEFGIIAISRVLFAFVGSVGLSGLTEYIIYYQGINKKEVYNSTFWLNFFLAILISLCIYILAPYFANYYQDTRITNITYLLIVSFFFGALSSIPLSLFKKQIQFKEIVLPKFFLGIITQISMLIMAYKGYGLYSIVIPPVFTSILSCVYYYYISSFKPSFNSLGLKQWRKIFSYTKYIIINMLFAKVSNEADTLIIGRKLDLKNLGLYDLSFVFSNLVYTNTMPIINNITFPIFSQNQNDLNKIKNHFLRLISISSFIYVPLTIFLILSAHITIGILYGPKWTDMVIPYQILSVYIVFRSISAPASSLYNALGKPKISTYYNLIFTPTLIMGIYFFTSYGLIATCIYIMTIRCLGSIYHIYKCKQLIFYTYKSIWKNIRASLVPSIISFLITLGVINQLENQFFCLVFPLLYLLFCLIFYKKSLFDQFNYILSFLKSKK